MAEITEAQARTELEIALQPGAHPCLDQHEVDTLVAAAVASQNIAVVKVHGWLMKCAKVAGMPDIKVGSNAVSNSQVYEACYQQAVVAAAMAGVSLPGQGSPSEGKGIGSIGTYRTDQNYRYSSGYEDPYPHHSI